MIENTIGFPGLGIEFTVHETAFSIFGLDVQWYGIILTTGIVCAFLFFYHLAVKVEKISEDHIFNVTLFAVPIAIIGARITYVLTSGYDYDSFWEVINIRNGGIAVYGSIIFGLLTMFVYCKIKKQPFLKIIDAAAPAEMLGQIIGRWGNFMNGEAYGDSANIGKLPWRMTIQEKKLIDGEWVNNGSLVTAHPTFLYESLWNLIGFIIITKLYKKKKKDGQIVLMYLAWYGLGRGLIEILRTDSCRDIIFGQKIFVYLGLGSFVVCSILLVMLLKKAKKDSEELKAYESVYGETACGEAAKDTLNVDDSEDVMNEDISPDENVEEHDENETGEPKQNDEAEDKKNTTDGDITPSDGDITPSDSEDK